MEIFIYMYTLKVSKELNMPHSRQKTLNHFIKYCIRALKLQHRYTVYIVNDRHKSGVETTAVYKEEDHTITVYGKGRAFADILRSVAHEFVHAKQHEFGIKFGHKFLHFNNKLEDEANSNAGEILNAYTDVMGHDKIYEN